ncbi:probable 4-coumarate--CoA ligase 1 [Wyeomyia smithii]|uniref:probable 4-coumarate--CoA ligase 1 n=1 Tax=Wyeomyia smithii TaxID=174621 RepID=UPI002467C85F|nr:probable 4-coumarate--CoA ligase 1 [Wyeomyia smithii]
MASPRDVFTFFDPVSKVWSGLKTPSIFNPNQSLGALVLTILERNSNKVVQICADTGARTTGAEIRLRAIRIALNLKRMNYGVSKEEVFAMAVRNGEHTAPVLFACFALGIPVNTLDPSFLRDDLSHMLSTVRPKVVFCDTETLQEMLLACDLVELKPRIIVMGDKVTGFDHVDDLLVPSDAENYFVPVNISDPSKHCAIMVCSSGTTGRSKAVCLSHSICIVHVANFFDCYPDDTIFAFSSLYWLSGLIMLLVGTIWGATRVITRNTFSSKLAVDIVERFRVSVVLFPPSQASAIVNDANVGEINFDCVRLALCGGGPVSVRLRSLFNNLLPGKPLQVAYGLTEIGCAVTLTKGGIGCEESVGFPKAGMEVKIADDHGMPLDNGLEGEIYARAKFVFLGYYGNDAATGDILDDEGWLHTGDIGRFDDNGLLYVVDRKKDILKYGNFQIAPSEIEEVVQEIPGVKAVCVVGIPADGNDLPAALVVPKDGGCKAEDILKRVEKKLGNYKQLRGGVYFTTKLPLTPSGKVLRREAKLMVMKMKGD